MNRSIDMPMNASAGTGKFFEKYKGNKIALYGLGTETQRALALLDNMYEIVGLLDSFRTDGELYGRRIVSFDVAVSVGVRLIIVVARPGSCRAIKKQIGKSCQDKGIALMDIRGKDLLEEKKVSYCFTSTDGITKAELEERIKDADVVSFDLFDTLVIRQTLYSDDVAEYVGVRLREKGICSSDFIADFSRKRLQSEKELSRRSVPSLTEIYQNMLDSLDIDTEYITITAQELAEIEWEIDFELIVPRWEVCDIFKETICRGKKVYVVSDTYYSQSQLEQILEKCGITEYTGILSSSECGTSKTQMLYQVLKNHAKAERYLHVGDDITTDIESAARFGIDTFRVYSGLEMYESAGGLGLSDYIEHLSDRLKIGMFVSCIFNSPFQFEKEDRRIEISDAYGIGYLLCAPLISDFVLWFSKCMEKNRFDNIWFSARDGYLIKKMYAYLMDTLGRKDESVYFLASRTAAVRAGMMNEDDIKYVDGMKFGGTLRENLQERFGIDIKNDEEKSFSDYQNIIFGNAIRSRENYRRYIENIDMRGGSNGKTAFFDFVAKGTTQMYIQRIVPNHLIGFYFMQLEPEYMADSGIDVWSFYKCEHGKNCTVYEDYYILETILTAPHPSVVDFDRNGQPIYARETRSDEDIHCSEKMQDGVMDYFKLYLKLCPITERTVDKEIDGIFLDLIHKLKISARDFWNLIIEDPFFNRMTDMADVI